MKKRVSPLQEKTKIWCLCQEFQKMDHSLNKILTSSVNSVSVHCQRAVAPENRKSHREVRARQGTGSNVFMHARKKFFLSFLSFIFILETQWTVAGWRLFQGQPSDLIGRSQQGVRWGPHLWLLPLVSLPRRKPISSLRRHTKFSNAYPIVGLRLCISANFAERLWATFGIITTSIFPGDLNAQNAMPCTRGKTRCKLIWERNIMFTKRRYPSEILYTF